jgi:hypothetical protein
MRAAIDAVGVQSVESRVASEAVRLSERLRRSKFTSPDHGLTAHRDLTHPGIREAC